MSVAEASVFGLRECLLLPENRYVLISVTFAIFNVSCGNSTLEWCPFLCLG